MANKSNKQSALIQKITSKSAVIAMKLSLTPLQRILDTIRSSAMVRARRGYIVDAQV